VLETYCGNRERIQAGDVEHIVSLQLSNHGYSSLKGIEHFASLEELDCSSNSLTELDLSNNSNLKTLNCGFIRIFRYMIHVINVNKFLFEFSR